MCTVVAPWANHCYNVSTSGALQEIRAPTHFVVWTSVEISRGPRVWTPSRVSILDLMLRSPHHRLIPPAVCGSWPCGAMLGPAASAVYVSSALTCSACDLLMSQFMMHRTHIPSALDADLLIMW